MKSLYKTRVTVKSPVDTGDIELIRETIATEYSEAISKAIKDCSHFGEPLEVYARFIRHLDTSSGKKFYCTVCGVNEVFPDQGEDTCPDCLRRV